MTGAIGKYALEVHSDEITLHPDQAAAVPATVATALLIGVAASLVLGVSAGPLSDLLSTAAGQVGALR